MSTQSKSTLQSQETFIKKIHSFQSFASKLANALCNGEDEVKVKCIFSKIEEQGILSSDPRLCELHRVMDNVDAITKSDLMQIIPKNIEMFRKLFSQKLAIPQFSQFKSRITDIYQQVKQNYNGKVADYIPQIAKANPDHFGVSICSIDGQQLNIGNYDTDFSVQSCCKIVNYCIALEQHGSDIVHTYVGKEPSGVEFNAITLDRNKLPHNPCTNAGAIMTCSLIGRDTIDIQITEKDDDIDEECKLNDLNELNTKLSSLITHSPQLATRSTSMNMYGFSSNKHATYEADRFELVNNIWTQLLAGDKIGFNNSVYLSEKSTGHRNYALGHFMYEQTPGFPDNTDLKGIMEFYFQCCSLEVTAKKLSYVAATLANGGINPFTGQQIFNCETVRNCLSVMFMCGMYDYSGEFAFKVGIPSKSGVSGAIISIIPGVMGVCTFSPQLDDFGNSVRGVQFISLLSQQFAFHHFDVPKLSHFTRNDSKKAFYSSRGSERGSQSSLSSLPLLDGNECNSQLTTFRILSYSSAGDLSALRRIYFRWNELNVIDYDFRTPIHIAAACGHLEIVKFL
eukprot:384565_1